jgi:hypothetical protein
MCRGLPTAGRPDDHRAGAGSGHCPRGRHNCTPPLVSRTTTSPTCRPWASGVGLERLSHLLFHQLRDGQCRPFIDGQISDMWDGDNPPPEAITRRQCPPIAFMPVRRSSAWQPASFSQLSFWLEFFSPESSWRPPFSRESSWRPSFSPGLYLRAPCRLRTAL